MLNYLWVGLIVSGFIAALLQGKVDLVTSAALNGAKEAVAISLGLISILVFWLGIMKIAEKSGLLSALTKVLRPFAQWLFPSIPKDHPAMGYILSNMSANLLGLGNAATPFGIKAMQELQRTNPMPDTATPAMCTLLALNTAGITLIPTIVIGLRIKYGSSNPTEIIGPTFLVTVFATAVAILLDRYFQFRQRKKE